MILHQIITKLLNVYSVQICSYWIWVYKHPIKRCSLLHGQHILTLQETLYLVAKPNMLEFHSLQWQMTMFEQKVMGVEFQKPNASL